MDKEKTPVALTATLIAALVIPAGCTETDSASREGSKMIGFSKPAGCQLKGGQGKWTCEFTSADGRNRKIRAQFSEGKLPNSSWARKFIPADVADKRAMLRKNIQKNVPRSEGMLSGYSEYGFEILPATDPVGEVSVCSRKRVVFQNKDGRRRDDLNQFCMGWSKEAETSFLAIFDYSEFNDAAVPVSDSFQSDAMSVLSTVRIASGG